MKKFHVYRGKDLIPAKIEGPRKPDNPNATDKIPPDKLVSYPHRLHNLDRGVFPLKGSGYALSIQLSPNSDFGFEIDVKSPTLLIHYNFGNNPSLEKDMKMMQKCMDADIPFGIIFKKCKLRYLEKW